MDDYLRRSEALYSSLYPNPLEREEDVKSIFRVYYVLNRIKENENIITSKDILMMDRYIMFLVTRMKLMKSYDFGKLIKDKGVIE
jgi:hypothetical protein